MCSTLENSHMMKLSKLWTKHDSTFSCTEFSRGYHRPKGIPSRKHAIRVTTNRESMLRWNTRRIQACRPVSCQAFGTVDILPEVMHCHQPVLATIAVSEASTSVFPIALGVAIIIATLKLKTYVDARLEFMERFGRLPGPDIPLNLLGSLRDIFAMPYVPGTQAKRDVFGFFSNLTRDFPDAYALWVFHPLLPFSRANFTINDPRLVQKFMEGDLKTGRLVKGKVYTLVAPLIGDGVLSSEGAQHARQRRAAEPGFKLETLELASRTAAQLMQDRYFPYIESSGRREPEGGVRVDVFECMLKATLDVLGQVAFGCDFNGLAEGGMYSAFETVITTLTVRTGQLPGASWLPTEANRKYDAALAQLDGTVQRIVRDRTQRPGQEGENGGEEQFDLLAALLATDDAGQPLLTQSEICDNVKTFLFAGHDTTAAALAWAVYLLAKHPEVADNLHAELESAAVKAGGADQLGFRQLQQLPYLDAFLKELLRLYPSAGFTRTCMEDIHLADGMTLPTDTDVFLFPYLIHRHPSNFERGEEFIPERWLPNQRALDNREGKYLNYYLPFSTGPRNCIGARVAAAEMKAILAQTVLRYRVSLPGDSFTPRPMILLTLFPSPFEAVFKVRREECVVTPTLRKGDTVEFGTAVEDSSFRL